MFCAKCGKEIDNDSMFCPYCGQKTAAPVENRSSKKKVSVKMPGKKIIGGIAVVVVVLLVVFGIFKIIGGISDKNESMAEKIFEMPVEDMAKLSEDDLKDMLDDEGILYEKEDAMYSFKGYDCIFGYRDMDLYGSSMGDLSRWVEYGNYFFIVAFDTAEDFNEGQKIIEEYLEKNLVEKNSVLALPKYEVHEGIEDTYASDIYLIECSDKGVEGWLEKINCQIDEFPDGLTKETLKDNLGDIRQNIKDYKMYKFIQIYYPETTHYRSIFPEDKMYTFHVCKMRVKCVPMTEKEYISYTGLWGYDAISHEKIDIEGFKGSVNEKMLEPYQAHWTKLGYDEERYRVLEEQMYRRLYMMEKHNFDIEQETYLKTDEEKRLWYIDNFNWDIDTDTKIDVSD